MVSCPGIWYCLHFLELSIPVHGFNRQKVRMLKKKKNISLLKITTTITFDYNVSLFYYIPSSEILEFPSVINFDIITSDDINFYFHFLP